MVDDSKTDSRQRSTVSNSRRRFLGGTAGALGVVGVGSAFTMPALAGGGPEPTGDDEPPEAVDSEFDDDVDILNYARTLELLEARFYEAALDNIEKDDILHMGVVDKVDDHLDSGVGKKAGNMAFEYLYDEIQVIQEHEEIHAEVLGDVIEDLGGDPVDEPDFDFGEAVEDPQEFIETAALLEDTGVAAYAGAATEIEDPDLIPPALSIHSVEGRHASFVRVLGGDSGFPNAFDNPLPRDDVEELIEPFIDD
ncbi:ferritin-like domain-containing protein [Halohasta litorea]|uniref:Ferritin-like domain-containing protein n=1 Tax=Halohasta litorea TaxID=869891 RepID=A0ABD6D809_9EURY|nr:ferritin-like domain-containing protein [Halohasta litorea]